MFPGGKMNQKSMMKKVKKMQEDLLKAQEDLRNSVIEVSSGGGMVKLEMNGDHRVVSIKIDKEAVDPDDVEMLEDLIMAAVNDASDQISKKSEDEMTKLSGGISIPGLF